LTICEQSIGLPATDIPERGIYQTI